MQFGIMNIQLCKRENKMPKKDRMIFDSIFLKIVHIKINHLLKLPHLLLLLIRFIK